MYWVSAVESTRLLNWMQNNEISTTSAVLLGLGSIAGGTAPVFGSFDLGPIKTIGVCYRVMYGLHSTSDF